MSDNLAEQTERGRRAAIVLEELKSAAKDLELQCFDTFKSSKISDDKGRLACRLYIRVLEDIMDRFEYAVVNGETARKKLNSE